MMIVESLTSSSEKNLLSSSSSPRRRSRFPPCPPPSPSPPLSSCGGSVSRISSSTLAFIARSCNKIKGLEKGKGLLGRRERHTEAGGSFKVIRLYLCPGQKGTFCIPLYLFAEHFKMPHLMRRDKATFHADIAGEFCLRGVFIFLVSLLLFSLPQPF